MARTKAKKWAPGEQTPRERVAKFGERLESALRHAELHSHDLADECGYTRRTVSQWLLGLAGDPWPKDIVAMARVCEVDARWLATGMLSPAADAALRKISDAKLFPVGEEFGPELLLIVTKVRNMVSFTPQPAIEVGRCRYCACIEQMACPNGCSWVDDDRTICSACLDPERVDG